MPKSSKYLVLVIHGGQSIGSRTDDGILIREIIKNNYATSKGNPIWSENLDKYLDSQKFEALSPVFPNATDFVYSEEARFFEQILSDINYQKYSGIILVSHSIGTIFLQNYLAQNSVLDKFKKTIKQLHFVAPTRDEGDFCISPNWQNISKQVNPNQIYIYHSKDDVTCAFTDGEFYHQNLKGSHFLTFENRGHLNQVEFEELVANINFTI
jgi:predicted alpha/beta hydrolase family esterase